MTSAEVRLPTLNASMASARMPAATNRPTHNSRLFRLIMSDLSQGQSSENEIQAQHGERRIYHRPVGGARHALRGRHRAIALEYRYPANHNAEHHALDDTVHDIVAEIHAILHLRPEGAGIHPQQPHAHQVSAHH